MIRRMVASIVCLAFIVTGVVPAAMAQGLVLPPAGQMVALSPASAPCLLRGMRVDASDPLRMDFLFDEGRAALAQQEFNDVSMRLIKYFLVSLTIPNKDLWVNLSPYESQRIVQEDLGRTAMGRDLLAQDYILKQLTASLLHPDGETGKVFWKEVYRRAYEAYGTTDIPVDTFNKVWIMPGRSLVHEMLGPDGKQISAFVDKVELKVMLESDYVAMSHQRGMAESPAPAGDVTAAQANALVPAAGVPDNSAVLLAKGVLREIVLPVLEKEVNEGANFAMLRQIVHALVLSAWLKRKLMASAGLVTGIQGTDANVFAQVFIDRHKTQGNEIAHPREENRQIYDRYVEAFRKGAYSLIKEELDTYSQELIPRKYFSGGFVAEDMDASMDVKDGSPDNAQGSFKEVAVKLVTTLARAIKSGIENKSSSGGKILLGLSLAVAMAVGGKFVIEKLAIPKHIAVVEQKEKKLTGQDVKEMLQNVAKNFKILEDGRSGRPTKKYTAQEILIKMMGKPNATYDDMAKMFQRYYDDLAPNFKAAGISSRVLFQIWIGESGIESGFGNNQSLRDAKERSSTIGYLQIQPTTAQQMFKIAIPVLERLRGAGYEREYKHVVALSKAMGYMADKDHWLVPKAFKMGMNDTKLQLIFQLTFMDDIFAREPYVPADDYYSRSFDMLRGQVTMPAKIKTRLASRRSMVASFVQLCKEYPQLSPERILIITWGASWNVGGPRTYETYKRIIELSLLSAEERISVKKITVINVQKAVGKRDSARDAMASFCKVNKIPFEEFLNGNSQAKVATRKWVKDMREKSDPRFRHFMVLFSRYGEARYALFLAQQEASAVSGARYGDVVYLMPLSGQEAEKFMEKNGRTARRFYEASFAGKQEDQKINNMKTTVALSKPLLVMKPDGRNGVAKGNNYKSRPKNKPVSHRNGKDRSQSTKAEIDGGIDLTDQAAGMDVQGDAGAFRFDLSPAQVKALDQDVQGILPLIINVQPVSDVRNFMGFGAGTGTSS